MNRTTVGKPEPGLLVPKSSLLCCGGNGLCVIPLRVERVGNIRPGFRIDLGFLLFGQFDPCLDTAEIDEFIDRVLHGGQNGGIADIV